MDLEKLIQTLIKHESVRKILLNIAQTNGGIMYLHVYKEDAETKKEYQILNIFARRGILEERQGSVYSAFTITNEGEKFLKPYQGQRKKEAE